MWNWRYWLKFLIFHWNGEKRWGCSRTTEACRRWWSGKWWWTNKYCIEYTTSCTKTRPNTQLASFKQSSKPQITSSYAMYQGIVSDMSVCVLRQHTTNLGVSSNLMAFYLFEFTDIFQRWNESNTWFWKLFGCKRGFRSTTTCIY